MNRRDFVKSLVAASAAAATVGGFLLIGNTAESTAAPTWRSLPRWRGFNLLEKFTKRREGNPPFQEWDFATMEEWGFDFARLPMSYHCWADPDPANWLTIREAEVKHIDEAIELGRKHKVHINLNFHRAPGYCVNPPKEPLNLWTDENALNACAFHWAYYAKRYKGIPNQRLSFDLLNEPADIPEETYAKVVRHLVEAIRAEDPERLIIADGLRWGTVPVHSLAGLRIGQSTRGYEPMQISHFRANWIGGSSTWAEPTWPLHPGDPNEVNAETLRKTRIRPWKELEQKGVGVHVGEWGAFNRTPHKVALAWMKDCLELWRQAGWGWSLWNLRGGFGVLDSQRADVIYEDFKGHKLDRAMLELLKAG
jgi:endoglucanase